MVLLKKMLEKIGFSGAVEACEELPQPGSNRGYKPLVLIESFMTSIWCGANKFLHTEIARHDQARSTRVSDYFYKWIFSNLKFDNITLDCDSTILTRYGKQQGAKRGYNPHKSGRVSHHPIMAFVADVKLVANFWLRSGNSGASDNFVSFLSDTFDKLQGKTVSLVRLDSGFHSTEVLDYLEGTQTNYIVAARFYEPIQHAIAGITTWLKLDEDIEVSHIHYQSPLWEAPRRVVVVRQRIDTRPNATGKMSSLFKDDQILNHYRYSAYITKGVFPNESLRTRYYASIYDADL